MDKQTNQQIERVAKPSRSWEQRLEGKKEGGQFRKERKHNGNMDLEKGTHERERKNVRTNALNEKDEVTTPIED